MNNVNAYFIYLVATLYRQNRGIYLIRRYYLSKREGNFGLDILIATEAKTDR